MSTDDDDRDDSPLTEEELADAREALRLLREAGGNFDRAIAKAEGRKLTATQRYGRGRFAVDKKRRRR